MKETWTARTTIRDLSEGSLFAELTHLQLVVYVRLLGESARHRTNAFTIDNSKLWREARTVQRVVKELEMKGLIKVTYTPRTNARRIEVL